MNAIVFDVAIVAVLLLFFWRGYSRGLILTLCGFLALFVAVAGAIYLSDHLASPVAKTIQPFVESSFQDILDKHAAAASSEEMSGLPFEEAISALQDSELFQGFADAIQSAAEEGRLDTTVSVAHSVATFLALQIARLILFVIAFVLILIAWFLLSHALDLAFHLPVLSSLNHWTGAMLGLLEGAVLLFVAAWLLKDSLIPPAAIRNSQLLHFFCTTNPLHFLLHFSS